MSSVMVPGLEIRFGCERSLDEIFAVIAGGGRRWVRRAFRGEFLVTATLAEGGVVEPLRIRIDPDFEDGRYRLVACWLGARDADGVREEIARQVLIPIGAGDVDELPGDAAELRAGGECAVFCFSTELTPAELHERLGRAGRAPWTLALDGGEPRLRAAIAGAGGLEQVRWQIRPRTGGHALEVLYDANPLDESRWRALVGEALDLLLPAAGATGIEEPDEWRVDIRKVEHHQAWSFSSDRSLGEMREILAARDAPPWQERDSAWYGDYLASVESGPYAEVTRLRIFEREQGAGYVLDVRWESEHPTAADRWRELERRLHADLLPTLGARDVAEADPYD
jgi:hypothetical protein